MKRAAYIIIFSLIFSLMTAVGFSGCFKGIDYSEYISEERTNLYVYEEDGLNFKVQYSNRETPYNTDGIKGEMCGIAEIIVTLTSVPDKVTVKIGGQGGEMNYLAVSKNFYLSFSCNEIRNESIQVELTVDDDTKQFAATSVLYDGVITGRQALKCVTEYDKELFDSLTDGRAFYGEIRIRLLYDDGCYYYVGVCDRNGNLTAYLLDGESGRIIAKRAMNS